MRLLPPLLLRFAGLAVAASCSSPTSRVVVSSPAPESSSRGTPAAAVALERETRYYTDEKGAVWDDRGRKMDAKP
jgi:hypothetical protein